MIDLIDRKAAINELEDAANNWNIAEPFNQGLREGYLAAARILRSLPAEQPEITQEQLIDYCHKRCLNIISSDILAKLLEH